MYLNIRKIDLILIAKPILERATNYVAVFYSNNEWLKDVIFLSDGNHQREDLNVAESCSG